MLLLKSNNENLQKLYKLVKKTKNQIGNSGAIKINETQLFSMQTNSLPKKINYTKIIYN